MAVVSGKPSSMLLISFAFTATMLATTGKAQLLLPPILPFLPTPGGSGGLTPLAPGEAQKCWSSLTSIQGCIMEIYTSFLSGQIGVIGPACCQAITQISDGCWPKIFPFNPFFPPLLKTFCSAAPPPSGTTNNVKKLHVPGLSAPLPGPEECWSSLANVKGCLSEIYRSLPGGQIGAIGPDCCKAITTIKDNCWPKMFPSNPFLPTLLNDSCLWIDELSAAAAPK